LLVVIGQFIYFNFFRKDSSGNGGEKSIAVLPFENLSNDVSQEYFSDGVADNILNELSKIQGLKVCGRSSSFQYRGKSIDLQEVGKKLRVATLLVGSLQKHGDQLRINASLIKVEDGYQIWSHQFKKDLKDIFAIQDEIASTIAQKMRVTLNGSGLREESLEAYELCLKGKYYYNKGVPKAVDTAKLFYKSAIELDPNYALAYAGLADCYRLSIRDSSLTINYSLKALSIDSTLGEAWTNIGFVQSHLQRDWAKGLKTLNKALRFSPSYSYAHLFRGNVFFFNGKTKEGINEIEEAINIDPLSVFLSHVLARSYFMSRNYEKAINQANYTLKLHSKYEFGWLWTALSFIEYKQYQKALETLNHLPDDDHDVFGMFPKLPSLSYVHALLGNTHEAEVILEKDILKHPKNYFLQAYVYIALKKYDDAFIKLKVGVEAGDLWATNILLDPRLDPIRSDPRFKELIKLMKFDPSI
ncbi:MAG TPA: hypothetical protein DGG95_15490, partial [Cytophagales bacterium]|nr:hypothetical protein [Cytophagales bacterium]